MRNDYYRGRMMVTIIALIGIMGLGYAFLHADLKINGVATIPSSSWTVRFKANSINVTTASYEAAKKKNGSSDSIWWLRAAYSYNAYLFFSEKTSGDWNVSYSNYVYGVSPAFRIA